MEKAFAPTRREMATGFKVIKRILEFFDLGGSPLQGTDLSGESVATFLDS